MTDRPESAAGLKLGWGGRMGTSQGQHRQGRAGRPGYLLGRLNQV